jgi:hypothetical protein
MDGLEKMYYVFILYTEKYYEVQLVHEKLASKIVENDAQAYNDFLYCNITNTSCKLPYLTGVW